MPGFVLQAREAPSPGAAIRFGFTASRRVGGAVVRNRARRRLKSLARDVLLPLARPGWDYVLIARAETATRPWAMLTRELADAARRVEAAPSSQGARAAAP